MDKEKKKLRGVGLGVGYISVMIIFAVLCLTIFAVLSLRAAGSSETLNIRGGDFTRDYYAADALAKQTLAALDERAKAASGSVFFEEEFEESASEVDGVKLSETLEGIRAEYSVPINEQQTLLVSVTFFTAPTKIGEYEITRWQCSPNYSGEDEDDEHLNVWDGTF